MKLGVVLPTGGIDVRSRRMFGWENLVEVAKLAEAEGLDSVWVSDHFLLEGEDGTIQGMHEAWTLLSALAVATDRIELGTLVLCSSFRTPALVAKMAATADLVSGGRITLGLGAGWYDREYLAFGYPLDHRVGRFSEAIEVIARLLRAESVSFSGRYETLEDAVLLPAPERRVPILVAAEHPRMLQLAARWADAWITAWYHSPNECLRERLASFDLALANEGRNPRNVMRVAGVLVDEYDDLVATFSKFAALGFDQVILEERKPTTMGSVERLARAWRRCGL